MVICCTHSKSEVPNYHRKNMNNIHLGPDCSLLSLVPRVGERCRWGGGEEEGYIINQFSTHRNPDTCFSPGKIFRNLRKRAKDPQEILKLEALQ